METNDDSCLSTVSSDVECRGNETDIEQCRHSPWRVNDCELTEAAAVSCLREPATGPDLPSPEIICDNEKIVARFLLSDQPRLNTDHLTVPSGSTGCGIAKSSDVHYVTVSIPFIGCGTQRQTNNSHIIYSSMIRYELPAEDPTITRSTVHNISVYCVNHRNHDPINRCSVEGTLVFHPINQTLFGFGFRSFRFIGNYTYLYVHCKAFVCDRDEKTPQCDRSCGVSSTKRKRRDVTSLKTKKEYDLEQGPFFVVATVDQVSPSGGVVESDKQQSDKTRNAIIGTSTATRIGPEAAAILLVTFFLWLQQAPSH
ncbi:hypothetical protein LSAT2_025758 [Lamellibrachia satsuma]|nr:hypothetical protein LSAT2_025758 [Lamellibrachia satsuma]